MELLIPLRGHEATRRYTPEIYERKCDLVYQHFYDVYTGQGQGV
jgi:type I restriction enzyme R subunit